MEQKIIFSNSYSPRTGHNFAAEVFKVFVNAEVLIHHRSETRLTTLLKEYFYIYDKHIFSKKDKAFFDHLFINNLRDNIVNKSKKEFIIVKDTSFEGVEHIKRVFPEDVQILLIRDPLSVLISGFKSMRLNKKGLKSKLKKIGLYVGIYPLYYALLVSYKQLQTIPNLDHFNVIQYENLVSKDDKTLLKLKTILRSEKSLEEIKKGISEIEVINTSFIRETGASKIWEAKKVTEKFNPINRKGHNILIRTALKIGSYSLRKKLGYI